MLNFSILPTSSRWILLKIRRLFSSLQSKYICVRKRLRSRQETVRNYVLSLAAKKTSIFGKTIRTFHENINEIDQYTPQEAMKTIRQFITDMKNYLIKIGEGDLNLIIESACNEFDANFNLDIVIEEVLHEIVIRPLKPFMYRLFISHYIESGDIQNLAANMRIIRKTPLLDLGVSNKDLRPPKGKELEKIKKILKQFQDEDLPFKKLDCLLLCVKHIYTSIRNNGPKGLSPIGADDFFPIFLWILVQCGMLNIEIESEYIWGLLPTNYLTGEEAYYLTTLSSLVPVIKDFEKQVEVDNSSWLTDSFSEFNSLVRLTFQEDCPHLSRIRINMLEQDIANCWVNIFENKYSRMTICYTSLDSFPPVGPFYIEPNEDMCIDTQSQISRNCIYASQLTCGV